MRAPMLVLIVDDEPMVAETLRLVFRQNGFSAEAVHSAEQALAFVSRTTPDLVLCDIEMPGEDGVSLMKSLGRLLPNCPILVLTGAYSSLARIRECAATLRQSVNILTKPCQPTDLIDAAGHMLRQPLHAA